MTLILQAGQSLPEKLPLELIPPSMRSGAAAVSSFAQRSTPSPVNVKGNTFLPTLLSFTVYSCTHVPLSTTFIPPYSLVPLLLYITILLTKITAALNEAALSYHRLRGLYFLAIIVVATILKYQYLC